MLKIISSYKNQTLNLNWIPNSLSFGSLFLGFLSIIFSSIAGSQNQHHLFFHSTLLIFLASVFDAFDGRIARRLKNPNPIGKELDSLADLVTFGIAPAILFYAMVFPNNPFYPSPINSYPLLGALISFLFPLFNALRLARFNALHQQKNLFIGIPTPMAALATTFFLTLKHIPNSLIFNFQFNLHFLEWWVAMAIFIFYALLMNAKFTFPKQLPIFFNFSKNSTSQNVRVIFSIIFLFFFFKLFLLSYAIIYTFKPILTFQYSKYTSKPIS